MKQIILTLTETDPPWTLPGAALDIHSQGYTSEGLRLAVILIADRLRQWAAHTEPRTGFQLPEPVITVTAR